MRPYRCDGQASVEYVILVGILLVILIPLFYYAFTTSSEKVKLSQAESTVYSLATAADEVYALSPGTKKYVWISIPGGIESSVLNGSEITLRVHTSGGGSDYTAFSKSIIVGNIPTEKGVYRIPVELLESGIVQIGSAEDTEAPLIVWKSPNGDVCNPIILEATTNEAASCKAGVQDLPYFAMTFSMQGNSLGHNYNLGVQAEGAHWYYVRCADAFGNTMNYSAIINYSIDYISCSGIPSTNETTPPVVTLLSPSAGAIANSSRISFYYNVIDNSSILLCKLFADSSMIGTAALPLRNVMNNITADLNKGNYVWSVNCTDAYGNEGNSSFRMITVNATLDDDLPVVKLILPLNGSVQKLSTVKFSYNVTDATSGINLCTLQAYGILDTGAPSSQSAVQFNVPEASKQNFTMSFDKGNYTWNVTCVDSSTYQNIGASETRWLRVNVSTEQTVITSCAGECWSEGYSDGTCRQELPKCDQNGETYVSAGNVFCTGGSQSDTCCCKP